MALINARFYKIQMLNQEFHVALPAYSNNQAGEKTYRYEHALLVILY